jgi:hypothetical protein
LRLPVGCVDRLTISEDNSSLFWNSQSTSKIRQTPGQAARKLVYRK